MTWERFYAILGYYYRITPRQANYEYTAYQLRYFLKELGWIKRMESGTGRKENARPGEMVQSPEEVREMALKIDPHLVIPHDELEEMRIWKQRHDAL